MSAIATAIVGTAIVGGIVSNNASRNAANAQTNAANAANATSQAQYDQTRADQAPWRDAGGQAIGQLKDLTGPAGAWSKDFSMADFTANADPGLDFRMQMGEQALQRAAASKGNLLGGGTLKALARYGQDYGTQAFNDSFNRFQTQRTNRFNQLASIAGLGQTANGQTMQAGLSNANNIGSNLMGAANAQGAAGIAGANAVSGALNNGVNNWLTYAGYK